MREKRLSFIYKDTGKPVAYMSWHIYIDIELIGEPVEQSGFVLHDSW